MNAQRGFTLVEILVAVAVFAVAGAMALGGMSAITRARAQVGSEQQRLADLQFAIGIIERDLRSVAERPVRDGYGPPRRPLEGRGDLLELSHYVASGTLAQARADIARVAYQLDGDRLLRLRYPVLDRSNATVPATDRLLDGVERIEWRYVGPRDAPVSALWPAPRGGRVLPRAVELRLTLRELGEIRRLFELPQGVAP